MSLLLISITFIFIANMTSGNPTPRKKFQMKTDLLNYYVPSEDQQILDITLTELLWL